MPQLLLICVAVTLVPFGTTPRIELDLLLPERRYMFPFVLYTVPATAEEADAVVAVVVVAAGAETLPVFVA